ncbi:hypothetical protein CF327_g1961 [Tilletia walkeri]|nr:hypothetical protein CF327_g1961 [Tilletia walkeri]
MSNYAELEVQPFCELTPANVKVIQAHGLRNCWPDQDYNFDTIYPRLFSHEHSPAASLLQGPLEDPDDISIDLRGAGPYEPKGEAALAQIVFMHLSKRSPRTDVGMSLFFGVFQFTQFPNSQSFFSSSTLASITRPLAGPSSAAHYTDA